MFLRPWVADPRAIAPRWCLRRATRPASNHASFVWKRDRWVTIVAIAAVLVLGVLVGDWALSQLWLFWVAPIVGAAPQRAGAHWRWP
jgi:hypothetical protein